MGKKDKVHFQYSGDLDAVDAELGQAMEGKEWILTNISSRFFMSARYVLTVV